MYTLHRMVADTASSSMLAYLTSPLHLPQRLIPPLIPLSTKQADTSNTGQLAKFNARFDMMREDEEAEAAPAAPAAGEKAPKRR